MEVSGQLHATPTLTPGKQPLVPIVYEAGLDIMEKTEISYRESNPNSSLIHPIA
jgi:hypothetical protein